MKLDDMQRSAVRNGVWAGVTGSGINVAMMVYQFERGQMFLAAVAFAVAVFLAFQANRLYRMVI